MLATVTIKGQVTLPKAIRDELKIEQGTQLDFQLNADGSMSVRALKRSALSIIGLLKRPGRVSVTVEQMNQAVVDAAAQRHAGKLPLASHGKLKK
jgi:antitoxin PrlF